MKFVRYIYPFVLSVLFLLVSSSNIFAGTKEFYPESGSGVDSSIVEIELYTDLGSSCRLSLTDEGYDDMSDDVDCTYDELGEVFFCTSPDLGSYGEKMLYLACMDGEGNKDSSSSNENISYVYGPNVKQDFTPISGSIINTPTVEVVFNTDPGSSCRLSLSDEGYDDMGNDVTCSYDEYNEEYSCTSPDLGVFGEKNIYVACMDGDGNKDLASYNSHLVYNFKANNVGEYIPEFPELGDYEAIKTMALSEDGTILYVGGEFTEIGGVARNYIAAINTQTYAVTDWYPEVNGYVYAIEVSGDDIYIGGAFTQVNGNSTGALARVGDDETVDVTCSGNMDINTGEVRSIEITDEYIYAGGNFDYVGEDEVYGIARFGNDNSCLRDSSWMTDYILSDQYTVPGTIYVLKAVGDALYVGGDFVMLYDPDTEEEINTGALIKVDSEGVVDTDCLPDIHTEGTGTALGIVYSLDIDNEYMYVGGNFDYVGDEVVYSVTRLGTNSCARDTSWNPYVYGDSGLGGSIYSIKSYGDGVFLGGAINYIGDLWTEFAKISKEDGEIIWDPKLRSWGMSSTLYDVVLDDDMLYIGGSFDHILTDEIFGLAAFPLEVVLPTGSVQINLGKVYTISPNVSLTMSATDSSGIREMMLCNNSSFSGCTWEVYTGTKSWSFDSSYGTKTVYVKYKDNAGNVSQVYSDSIIFHTPTVRITKIGTIVDIPDSNTLTYYFTSNSAQISGITQAGSTVYFKYGGNTYSSAANSSGNFSITLGVSNGTNGIEYYSRDVSGNESVKKSLNLTVGTEFFPEWLLIKLGLVVDEEEETPEEQEEEVVPEEPEIPEVVKPDEEKKTQVLQFLDGEGKPLSNASLEIEGKKYVTDSNGEVKVSGLEEGKKYKVNIKHNGKVYESEVLGASEVDESVKIEVTQDQRVVDWKKILLYSAIGIGLLFLIVLIFRKKHS